MGRPKPPAPRVPRWVVEDAAVTFDLEASELIVLFEFAVHCGAGVGFVTDRRMNECTRLAVSTIKLARARLVRLGLLVVEVEAGRGKATRYSVPAVMPLPPSVLQMPTRSARQDGSGWVANGPAT